jgi:arylsulfatase A-like enzyme
MPDNFRQMYDPDKIKLPPNFQEVIDTNYPLMVHRDEHLAAYPRQEAEIKRHIAEYFAMITHLDYEIGRLLQALEESGERDNTIIVFTGDNGLAVGQHGWLGKEDIYEHGVRVPLIMAGPGIAENNRNKAFVYLYDIFPTLCEKVGIDVPDSVDGKSFAQLLDGKHGDKFRDELYLIFDEFVRGVKDDNYKLIEYRNGDTEDDKWTFLYNLKNDPWEKENLAECDGYKDKINEMREKIINHRDEWEEQSHPWGVNFWKRF